MDSFVWIVLFVLIATGAVMTLVIVGLMAVGSRLIERFTSGEAPKPLRPEDCGWWVCYGCGFDLRGLGEEGNCPECGRGFPYERCLESWGVLRDPRLDVEGAEGARQGWWVRGVGWIVAPFAAWDDSTRRHVLSGLGCAVLVWLGVVAASGGLWERVPFVVIDVEWPFVSVSMADGGAAAWHAGAVLAVPVFMAVTVGSMIFGESRRSREARAAGCRVCVHCGTKLSEETDRGFCPGCGVPWTIEGLRERWGEKS